MYGHEERRDRGRAARANAEAFAAADDLLRSDLGRAYSHEALTAQLGLGLGDTDDVDFVASTLDTVATVLAVGVDVLTDAQVAASAAEAGWDAAADSTTLEGDLAVCPQGLVWFDVPVGVGCRCGQDHPDVVGLVWRRVLTDRGDPAMLLAVVADTHRLDDPTLPRYVLDGLVLFDAAGMADNVPTAPTETGSLEWATGVARWALRQGAPSLSDL